MNGISDLTPDKIMSLPMRLHSCASEATALGIPVGTAAEDVLARVDKMILPLEPSSRMAAMDKMRPETFGQWAYVLATPGSSQYSVDQDEACMMKTSYLPIFWFVRHSISSMFL